MPSDLPSKCQNCGTEVAVDLLSCPRCQALLHSAELERLAETATSATKANQYVEALTAWRRAYSLLPPGTRQREAVEAKIDALVQLSAPLVASHPENLPSPTDPRVSQSHRSFWGKASGIIGAVGVLLFKFKFALIFILSKFKLLLLGLTKMSTLLSMFISFGFYCTLWGWRFAAGFVLSIYVHEMGHIAMLHRLGIRCTAPMFIPGFGALIRLKENLPTAREEALVGLAGPIWGLGAALVAWILGMALNSPMCTAIAHFGAVINLFNLTPVWQLDGSHAFRALTKTQRWIAVGGLLTAWAVSHLGILLLILAVATYRAFGKDPAPQPNHRALGEFLFLVATLSILASITPLPQITS